MGGKPIFVTPQNPLVRMRSHPGILWALLGLCLCSSCSIPPTQPATNQRCLPLLMGCSLPSFSQSSFSSLLPPWPCWLPAELRGGQEGLCLQHPPQCCPSGSHLGLTSLSKSLVSWLPAWPQRGHSRLVAGYLELPHSWPPDTLAPQQL